METQSLHSGRCRYLDLLSVFLVFSTVHNLAESESTELRLHKALFTSYDTSARPRLNSSDTVSVSITYSLSRLDGLEERRQVLITSGWITAAWYDELLQWDPANYSGLNKVVVPASYVWLPAFALDNSAADVYQSAFYDKFRVTIKHNGYVIWEPGGTIETSCEVDNTFYPFDDQHCIILFANWIYTINQVNLSQSDPGFALETYTTNSEWNIIGATVWRKEYEFDDYPGDIYPEVGIELHIRRKSGYYILNTIIPCILLSVLVLMGFHLPADAGEKVSLGVTVLLSFSVFQLMIAENLPVSSDHTPLIEYYMLCFMGTSAFSVFAAVVVLNLHHRTEYTPPPAWMRKLVLQWLARLVLMHSIKVTAVNPFLPKVSPISTNTMSENIDSRNRSLYRMHPSIISSIISQATRKGSLDTDELESLYSTDDKKPYIKDDRNWRKRSTHSATKQVAFAKDGTQREHLLESSHSAETSVEINNLSNDHDDIEIKTVKDSQELQDIPIYEKRNDKRLSLTVDDPALRHFQNYVADSHVDMLEETAHGSSSEGSIIEQLTVFPSSTRRQSLVSETSLHPQFILPDAGSIHNTTKRDQLPPVHARVARSALRLMNNIGELADIDTKTATNNATPGAVLKRTQSLARREAVMQDLADSLKELSMAQKEAALESLLENEWKCIAKVVDRFFFYVTLTFLVVLTWVILGRLADH